MTVDASRKTAVMLFGCHLLAEHISVGKKNLLLNFATEHDVCVRMCVKEIKETPESTSHVLRFPGMYGKHKCSSSM